MRAADRRKLNRDAGFSLLELLIAVVILAIIVIPLLNMFLTSNRLNIKSRQTLRATTAAQDIMEGLKAYDISEIKAQFSDPSSGFYVIDDQLIKGEAKEEPSLETDPGLYVFSVSGLTMQGSQFDALIRVDGRNYREPSAVPPHAHEFAKPAADGTEDGRKCTVCGVLLRQTYNSAALADARGIDKENGSYVESDEIRQRMLKKAKEELAEAWKSQGITDAQLLELTFKNLAATVNPALKGQKISRTIEFWLRESADPDAKDENGDPMVDVAALEYYEFPYYKSDADKGRLWVFQDGKAVKIEDSLSPTDKANTMSAARFLRLHPIKCVSRHQANLNLFYYPLYGDVGEDKIVVRDNAGVKINLLIAKQRYETSNPTNEEMPDLDDPEYLTDPQLQSAEQGYRAKVEFLDGGENFLNKENFSLKTNLGLNLAGKKYAGAAFALPGQLTLNGTDMALGGGDMNIFTLDGVRSPMGKAAALDEVTELIYDATVSVYQQGAAAAGFPEDKKMVEITGSKVN